MNNLTQRFITGFIGVSLVTLALLYSEASCLFLLLVIAFMSVYEFYHLCNQDGIQPQRLMGLATATLLFLVPLLNALFAVTANVLPVLLLLPFLVFIRELFSKAEKPFTNIAYTLLAVIYLALPLFLFYLIAFQGIDKENFHGENLMGYFIILWSADTGAYFAGRFLGKRKLFERISPKKTWEGVYGSIVFAAVAVWIVSGIYTNIEQLNWWVITGIILITATLGDLVESLFKRSIHIKDSGAILPGHGGFLDRFDGLFISAPFVFVYLLLFS